MKMIPLTAVGRALLTRYWRAAFIGWVRIVPVLDWLKQAIVLARPLDVLIVPFVLR